jgi:serine/threonine protein kinase
MSDLFKIFDKSSMSPTIMIKFHIDSKPVILKAWNTRDESPAAKALTYEIKAYEEINNLLEKDPTLPYIKYIGSGTSSVGDIGEQLIKIKSTEDRDFFKAACRLFFSNTAADKCIYSKKNLEKFRGVDDNILSYKMTFIILPFIEYYRFTDFMNVYKSSIQSASLTIKELIRGIAVLYNNGIVHNDLHATNVMIGKTNSNIYIFDWDRSYIKDIDNPLLNKDKCKGDCGNKSQCNIYNKGGYAIDMYKILSFILSIRVYDDSCQLLPRVFGIYDTEKSSLSCKQIISKLIKNQHFFTQDGCTYLQYPDEEMTQIKELFGPINKIYENIDKNIEKYDQLQNLKNSVKLSFNKKRKSKRKSNKIDKQMNTSDLTVKQLYELVKKGDIILPKSDPKPKKLKKPLTVVSTVDIIKKNNMRKYGPAEQ